MTLLVKLALMVALVSPADDSHQDRPKDEHHVRSARGRAMHAAWRLCSNARPTACIRYATLRYRQSYEDALRVARCESTLDPSENYAGHAGLFQFRVIAPSTWATTPYRRRNPYSARWNSLAAMWMWSVGRRREWACA